MLFICRFEIKPYLCTHKTKTSRSGAVVARWAHNPKVVCSNQASTNKKSRSVLNGFSCFYIISSAALPVPAYPTILFCLRPPVSHSKSPPLSTESSTFACTRFSAMYSGNRTSSQIFVSMQKESAIYRKTPNLIKSKYTFSAEPLFKSQLFPRSGYARSENGSLLYYNRMINMPERKARTVALKASDCGSLVVHARYNPLSPEDTDKVMPFWEFTPSQCAPRQASCPVFPMGRQTLSSQCLRWM